ncbi:MAG: hypothetical protein OIF50_11865, partial [Flavobacteriaceae bacterium]|nr:hypothetical protein [Flavobacteriaceae bacterium]
MKIPFKSLFLGVLVVLCAACDSNEDDNCTKTIQIPQFYLVNNQSYRYDTTQEVPCDFPDPTTPKQIDPPALENFSYEVLDFTYTPDTGNNTSRLQFSIKLNNPNNFEATGVPILTIKADEVTFSGSFSKYASVPCLSIAAKASCILTYDMEESLDLGSVA